LQFKYPGLFIPSPEQFSTPILDAGIIAGQGAHSLVDVMRPFLHVHDSYLFVYNDSNLEGGEIYGLVKSEGKWNFADGHFRNSHTGLRDNPDDGVAILATFETEEALINHLQTLFNVDAAFMWGISPVFTRSNNPEEDLRQWSSDLL